MRDMLVLLKRKKQRQQRNRWWVRPLWQDRKTKSEYWTATKKMRDHGDFSYFDMYIRMMPETFDRLHDLVKDDLTKQHVVREPLTSNERLALTLRYLSSGMAFKDVAMAY